MGGAQWAATGSRITVTHPQHPSQRHAMFIYEEGLSPADPVPGERVLKRHLGLLRSQLNPAKSYKHEESTSDT